ncbi:hypothetical protein BpHYR1_050760 [Brachionus plicatilis]|uniref:Uncharacterized protein n=1 Tax=Brachionus plicatilis TaxID=10195 RepID=A0A3M7PAG9_BRAPC|nr:hypothetical protein BpHYR1_050760 [Brachionus plicatilis]
MNILPSIKIKSQIWRANRAQPNWRRRLPVRQPCSQSYSIGPCRWRLRWCSDRVATRSLFSAWPVCPSLFFPKTCTNRHGGRPIVCAACAPFSSSTQRPALFSRSSSCRTTQNRCRPANWANCSTGSASRTSGPLSQLAWPPPWAVWAPAGFAWTEDWSRWSRFRCRCEFWRRPRLHWWPRGAACGSGTKD